MEMYAAQQTGTFSARYLPDQSLSDIDSVLENHFSVHSLLKAVVRSRCDSGGISSRCYSGGKFHTYHGPHTNAPPFISSRSNIPHYSCHFALYQSTPYNKSLLGRSANQTVMYRGFERKSQRLHSSHLTKLDFSEHPSITDCFRA